MKMLKNRQHSTVIPDIQAGAGGRGQGELKIPSFLPESTFENTEQKRETQSRMH